MSAVSTFPSWQQVKADPQWQTLAPEQREEIGRRYVLAVHQLGTSGELEGYSPSANIEAAVKAGIIRRASAWSQVLPALGGEAAAMGRAAATGVLPAAGALLFGAIGTTAGLAGGPFAPITVPALGIVGAAEGAILADKAQGAALQAVAPKVAERLAAKQAEDIEQHPVATRVGSVLGAAPVFAITPVQAVRNVGALIKSLAVTYPSSVSAAEVAMAKQAAIMLGLGAGMGVVSPLLEGQPVTAGGVAEAAATLLLFGKARRPWAKLLGENPIEAVKRMTPQERQTMVDFLTAKQRQLAEQAGPSQEVIPAAAEMDALRQITTPEQALTGERARAALRTMEPRLRAQDLQNVAQGKLIEETLRRSRAPQLPAEAGPTRGEPSGPHLALPGYRPPDVLRGVSPEAAGRMAVRPEPTEAEPRQAARPRVGDLTIDEFADLPEKVQKLLLEVKKTEPPRAPEQGEYPVPEGKGAEAPPVSAAPSSGKTTPVRAGTDVITTPGTGTPGSRPADSALSAASTEAPNVVAGRTAEPVPDAAGEKPGTRKATTPPTTDAAPSSAKPPEQMTPEEAVKGGIRGLKPRFTEHLAAYDALDAEGKQGYDEQAPGALAILRKANQEDIEAIHETHANDIRLAAIDHKPVSSASVDAYGIKLPTGYVRDGDRRVFRPETTFIEAKNKETPNATVPEEQVKGAAAKDVRPGEVRQDVGERRAGPGARDQEVAQAPARAPAPETGARERVKTDEHIPKMERVDPATISHRDADDGYLYHVTSEPNAAAIEREGLKIGSRQTVQGGAYQNYSRGRLFFTERAGVPYWMDRIEQHLFHANENPPDIAVVRIPKTAIPDIKTDKLGSDDSGHASFFIDKSVGSPIARVTPEPGARERVGATTPAPSLDPSHYSFSGRRITTMPVPDGNLVAATRAYAEQLKKQRRVKGVVRYSVITGVSMGNVNNPTKEVLIPGKNQTVVAGIIYTDIAKLVILADGTVAAFPKESAQQAASTPAAGATVGKESPLTETTGPRVVSGTQESVTERQLRQLLLDGFQEQVRRVNASPTGRGAANVARISNYIQTHTLQGIWEKYPAVIRRHLDKGLASFFVPDIGKYTGTWEHGTKSQPLPSVPPSSPPPAQEPPAPAPSLAGAFAEVQRAEAPATRPPPPTQATTPKPVVTQTTQGKTVETPLPPKVEATLTRQQQKQYLLAEIDKALSQAPQQAVAKEVPAELTARIADATERLEQAKAALPEGNATPSTAEGLAYLRAKDEVDNLGSQATLAGRETITIEVPGDGKYTLWNDAQTLADFRKRIEKGVTAGQTDLPSDKRATIGVQTYKFPTGQFAPAPPPRPPSMGQPATVRIAKETPTDPAQIAKIASVAVSTDVSRGTLQQVNFNKAENRFEASDGRRALFITANKGVKWTGETVANYPDAGRVLPTQHAHELTIDVAAAVDALNLAQKVEGIKVGLYIGKDGALGVSSWSADYGTYITENAVGEQAFAAVQPALFRDGLEAMARLGNDKATVFWTDSEQVMELRGNKTGKHARYVLMPMRGRLYYGQSEPAPGGLGILPSGLRDFIGAGMAKEPTEAPRPIGYVRTAAKRVRDMVIHGQAGALPAVGKLRQVPQTMLREQKLMDAGVELRAQDLRRAVHESWKTRADRDAVAEAIHDFTVGEKPIDPSWPEAVQDRAIALRNHLDKMTTEAVRQGLTGDKTSETWLGNLGEWVKRRYKAFDPTANWTWESQERLRQKGDTAAIARYNDAKALLRAEHPDFTPQQIDTTLRGLLARNETQGVFAVPEPGAAGTGEGARIAISSMLHRKNIPVELRRWMGEIRDGIENFEESGRWMSQFLARGRAQQAIRKFLLEHGLASEAPEGLNTEPLVPEAKGQPDLAYFPLQGLFASPDMVAAMRAYTSGHITEIKALNDLLVPLVEHGTSLVKTNLVGLSPQTYMPNIVGGAITAMQAGVWNPLRWIRAVKATAGGRGMALDVAGTAAQLRRRADWLASRTVSGESVLQQETLSPGGERAGHTVRGELARGYEAITQILDDPKGQRVQYREVYRAFRNLISKPGDWFIAKPDDVNRLAVFFNEMNVLEKAYPEWTRRQFIEESANRAENKYQTYSRIFPLVRGLSRFGVLGSFVTWPIEFMRNTFHGYRYAFKDLASKNPVMRQHGATELAMALAVTAAGIALKEFFEAQSGLTDEQIAAIQRTVTMRYDKGNILLHLSHEPNDPVYKFALTSYLIPSALTWELARAAYQTVHEPDLSTATYKAAEMAANEWLGPGALMGPFIEEGPKNKRKGWAGVTDWATRAFHNLLVPRGAAMGYELYRSQVDPHGDWGKEYDAGDIGKRVAGMRVRSVNTHRKIVYDMRQIDKEWNAAAAYSTSEKYRVKGTRKEAESLAKAQDYTRKTQDDLRAVFRQAVADYRVLAVPEATIQAALKGLPVELRYAAIPDDTRSWLDGFVEAAAGDDEALRRGARAVLMDRVQRKLLDPERQSRMDELNAKRFAEIGVSHAKRAAERRTRQQNEE